MAETAATANEPWVPDDTFGTRLAIVRQRMGWNVSQAAASCGLSHASWHNWEQVRTKPRDLEDVAGKIADASGCDYVWLMVGGPLRTGSFASLSLLSAQIGQGSMLDEADHALDFWSRADLASVGR